MKTKALALIVSAVLGMHSISIFAQENDKATEKKPASTAKLETEIQKVSYALGADMGSEFSKFKEISSKNEELIDLDTFIVGLRDSYEGKELALSEDEMMAAMRNFAEKVQNNLKKEYEESIAKSKAEGEKFLAENKKKPDVKETASGLQYKVISEGKGKKPGKTDIVKVHYKGSLVNGKVFDESGDEPVEFPIEGVIDGWAEGLQLMSEGSKYELYIPAQLAYGEEGQPTHGILPNAVLIFEVSLDSIVEQKKSGKKDK